MTQMKLMYFVVTNVTMASRWMLLLTLLALGAISAIQAQTQAPSVTTGVTFQWSDTQSNNNDPATIASITINSDVYQSFTAPSSYKLTRLGPDGHSYNNIVENGTELVGTSSDPNWDDYAITAFQDQNLNHYFNANRNGRDICNDFLPLQVLMLKSRHFITILVYLPMMEVS